MDSTSNNVKQLREKQNMTQSELAEKASVSLRTVQRVENRGVLKGFTLTAIANALNCPPEELFLKNETTDFSKAKLINLSVLAGLLIPYGSIIFPLILTSKTKDETNKNIGKKILEVQIILSFILSVSMIICPFLQKAFALKTPLFIYVLIFFLLLKLLIVIKNGMTLNQNHKLYIFLKNNYL